MNINKSAQSWSANLLRWVGTLLSIVLLVYLLNRQGWDEIGQALAQIPLWIFMLAAILMLISRFAVTGRWYALLHVTNEDVSWWQIVRLTFAGLFATNFLPTTIGGDIVRLAGAVQSGLDGLVIAASLIVDRLVGMAGMVLMVPLGFLPLLSWFSTNQVNQGLTSGSGILLAGNTGFRKIWQKVVSVFRKIFQSLKFWWREPASLLGSFVFTAIHMLCFFGILWALFVGLGDPIPFHLIAGLYSFVYLVTLLPISINGYGLQELSISVIFSQVGGVSLQNSLTVALIFRTLTMLASLPGAAFVPGILAGRKGSLRFQGEETDGSTQAEVED